MSKEISYVSKKEVKEYKKEMQDALIGISGKLRSKESSGFSVGLVGSAKRNLVLVKGNSIYDVDFQCFIQKSVEANFREKIYEELKIVLNEDDGWSHKNSTSVITSVKGDEKSFDTALVSVDDEGSKIAKLVKGKGNKNDVWTWNQLPKSIDHSSKRKSIKGSEQWTFLRNDYKTIRTNQWDETKKNKKTSYALFNESVNNTFENFRNKK